MNHIASIHTVKTKLVKLGVMDDEGYRAVLVAVAGVASCKDMSPLQLAKTAAHFQTLAGKHGLGVINPAAFNLNAQQNAVSSPKKPSRYTGKAGMARVLWARLCAAGKMQHNTDAALTAWAQAHTRCAVDDLSWLSDPHIDLVLRTLRRMVAQAKKQNQNA